MEPYIGEIRMFAGDYAPRGWALCDGRLLSVNHYHTLFSIIQTYYGGDGMSNFAVPDLRGRAAIQPGQGPGLSNYQLGQRGGAESVTITQQQMPAHSHSLMATNAASNQPLPAGNAIATYIDQSTQLPDILFNDLSDQATTINAMNARSIGTTGGSQPLGIMQPYLAINYIIALEGIYPPRP